MAKPRQNPKNPDTRSPQRGRGSPGRPNGGRGAAAQKSNQSPKNTLSSDKNSQKLSSPSKTSQSSYGEFTWCASGSSCLLHDLAATDDLVCLTCKGCTHDICGKTNNGYTTCFTCNPDDKIIQKQSQDHLDRIEAAKSLSRDRQKAALRENAKKAFDDSDSSDTVDNPSSTDKRSEDTNEHKDEDKETTQNPYAKKSTSGPSVSFQSTTNSTLPYESRLDVKIHFVIGNQSASPLKRL